MPKFIFNMINNQTIKTQIMRLFRIQPNEPIPIAVPVITVDKPNVCAYLDTSGTIYSVPAKGRFILTGVEISYYKAAGDTGTLIRVDVTLESTKKSARICHMSHVTSVAYADHKEMHNLYVELEPGTTISGALSGTFTSKHYTIYGIYYPE